MIKCERLDLWDGFAEFEVWIYAIGNGQFMDALHE